MNNALWDFFSSFPWIVKPQDQIIISATCQTPYSQKLLVAAYLSVAFCCVMLWEVCYVGLLCCIGLCYAMRSLLCWTCVLYWVVLCYVKFVMLYYCVALCCVMLCEVCYEYFSVALCCVMLFQICYVKPPVFRYVLCYFFCVAILFCYLKIFNYHLFIYN